jgi:hypothetical protein
MIGKKNIVWVLVWGILFLTGVQLEAWSFSEFFSNQKEMFDRSRRVSNGVRELYRERGAIVRFNDAALNLIQTYKKLQTGGGTNFTQLAAVGRDIMQVVKDYQTLAPRFDTVYTRISPDIDYFSKMLVKPTVAEKPPRINIPAFSESEINSYSRLGGVDRMWRAVKSDWTNIFRWGRLAGEYKMGKAEDAYIFKTIQIGLEMSNMYDVSRSCVGELMSIKGDLEKMLGGDLNSILGVSGTLSKISGAGPYIQRLGDVAQVGPKHLDKRFSELKEYQDRYVKQNLEYQKKFGNANPVQAVEETGTSLSLSPVAETGQTTVFSTPGIVPSSGIPASSDQLRSEYERLYREYVKQTGNPKTAPAVLKDLGARLRSLHESLKKK